MRIRVSKSPLVGLEMLGLSAVSGFLLIGQAEGHGFLHLEVLASIRFIVLSFVPNNGLQSDAPKAARA